MTQQEKNAFGCMGVLAVGAFLWGSAVVIGSAYEQAFHPERVEVRRQAEATRTQQREVVVQAEAAAEAARDAARDKRDREQRQRENACIRQLGYEECRRIYHPTSEERAAQAAITERAGRIAEAYRDQ